MDKDILDSVAFDLFSTLPLIHRSINRKLIKTVVTSFKEDIAPPHFQIMKLLEEAGTLHVAEIGERLQIARPQMTHLIDRLVALDIVERETDEDDRRMLNIRLKDKGKSIVKARDKQVINATREALSGLTDDELKQLSMSLNNIKDIFSKLV
ncbi:MAG: MarR family transcriptional regulator [Dehalococcoidales bacterium]|nr:MAG: MarR family transcriptional regulator [Dehalococcoidales bacterium]